jgi:hypothetical protein
LFFRYLHLLKYVGRPFLRGTFVTYSFGILDLFEKLKRLGGIPFLRGILSLYSICNFGRDLFGKLKRLGGIPFLRRTFLTEFS